MGALKAHVAYSKRNDKSGIDISNIATGHGAASQSKLYTETFWNYGLVGAQNAQAISVAGAYDMGATNLTLQYTTISNDTDVTKEANEIALTATTKVGPLDATVALINTVADNNALRDGNTVQVYLTAPFSL